MKKMLLLCLALSLVFFLVTFAAAADSTAVNGYVSDSLCGAKGAADGHAACMKKCMDKGAKMVVVTDDDKKVLEVENPDALKGHEGHHVTVTGHVNGNMVHVDSVKMM